MVNYFQEEYVITTEETGGHGPNHRAVVPDGNMTVVVTSLVSIFSCLGVTYILIYVLSAMVLISPAKMSKNHNTVIKLHSG